LDILKDKGYFGVGCARPCTFSPRPCAFLCMTVHF